MKPSFWSGLKQLSSISLEHSQYLQNNPSLPLQLIQKTLEQGAIYLTPETPLAFSAINDLSLSVNQQLALNLATANTPLMVIQGVPGSGKTRLAQILIRSLIAQQKSILILTHYPETKAFYHANLGSINTTQYHTPVIPFSLAESEDYDTWLSEKLQQEYLGKLPMDFLPLHLLPDALLAKLRTPQKLEKWLNILQDNPTMDELKSLSSTSFYWLVC